MANDKEVTKAKKAPESGSLQKASAEKNEKDKSKDKSKESSKSGAKKGGIIKYFKDAKAEFKKVVWPTPKSTTNNTLVVIAVCLIAGIFIFGVDSLFGLINRLILG